MRPARSPRRIARRCRMAAGPWTTSATSQACSRNAPSDDLFAQAAAMAAEDCSPADDARGPADYKRHLAQELTHRALRRAAAHALHQEV